MKIVKDKNLKKEVFKGRDIFIQAKCKMHEPGSDIQPKRKDTRTMFGYKQVIHNFTPKPGNEKKVNKFESLSNKERWLNNK